MKSLDPLLDSGARLMGFGDLEEDKFCKKADTCRDLEVF